jgi:short-subunit dehydrogenase
MEKRMSRKLMDRNNFMGWEHPGTALVTGAPAGIGESFARKLASQGFDVILVARRRDRLEKLACSLQREHNIVAEVCVADLSKTDDVERIEKKIAEAPTLDVLVNNAGFGVAGKFFEVPLEKELEMKTVHLDAPIRLTRAAVPGMMQRRRGVIIQVSSLSSFFRMPGSVMYNSTKACIREFSASLAIELCESGVKVQALCPGFTHTEFQSATDYSYRGFDGSVIPKALFMNAEDVVQQSLSAVRKNKVIFIPGFKNRCLLWFLNTWMGKKLGMGKLKKSGRI